MTIARTGGRRLGVDHGLRRRLPQPAQRLDQSDRDDQDAAEDNGRQRR
jgi:hypothetical protein